MRSSGELRSREEIERDEAIKKSKWAIFAWAFMLGSGITYNSSKHAIVTFEWASQKFEDPAIIHGLMLFVIVFSHEVCLILFLIYSERWNPRITRFCIVPITAILVAPFCFHDPIFFAAIILNAAGGLLWYIAFRLPEDVKLLEVLISFAFGGLCHFGASWFGLGFSTFMVATSVHLWFNHHTYEGAGLNPNPTHKGAEGVREIRLMIDQRRGDSAQPICLYHDPSSGASAEPIWSDDDQRSGASPELIYSYNELSGGASPELIYFYNDLSGGASAEPICSDDDQRSGGSPESICLSSRSSADPFCSDDDQTSGASDDDQTSGRLLLGPVRLAPPEPVFSQVDQRSGGFAEPICCDHGQGKDITSIRWHLSCPLGPFGVGGASAEPICCDDDQRCGASAARGLTIGGQLGSVTKGGGVGGV